ncbi:MAG: RNA-guided pseudouridylation complex pseudouridine synthase subunit Cbf5, partial [Salinirussus sp.]
MLREAPHERAPGSLLEFGIINVDKPAGPSAHQVTAWVRDEVSAALEAAGEQSIDRAAHAGTLDPKVTGSLPVLLGDAARIARVFDTSPKTYVAVLELHGPLPNDFAAILEDFEGEIYQRPPKHSAVARRLRTRFVHEIDVLEREDRRVLLRIRCEAGTYVRKLCHHVGLALGTGAHMGDLRRIETGPFDDTDLVSLPDLADAIAFWLEDGDDQPLRQAVDPAERALEGFPHVVIAPSAAREVANGAPI